MEFVTEIIKGFGYLFINPLFYLLIIASFAIGVKRVKKERIEFHTRIFDAVDELKTTFGLGIVLGICFSIVTIYLGLSFSPHTLAFLASMYCAFLVVLRPKNLSPALVIGISSLFLMIVPSLKISVPVIGELLASLQHISFVELLVLIGTLTLIEGLLIIKSGSKNTSPLQIESKRGKLIGAHESNKLWLVPLMVFIPVSEGAFSPNWWPALTVAGESYAPVLFPFVIGFYQFVKGKLPELAIFTAGLRVLALSALIIVGAVLAFYFPIFIPITIGLAIIIREGLSLYERYIDSLNTHFFTNREDGIIVLGIIPNSPASKMDICVGETIHKVNGKKVFSQNEFYEALQINSAFCKLEVMDVRGEIRFANRALFTGDHHELGLIFVDDKVHLDVEEVAT